MIVVDLISSDQNGILANLALAKGEIDMEDIKIKMEPQDEVTDSSIRILSGKLACSPPTCVCVSAAGRRSVGVSAILLRTLPLTFNSF